MLFSAIFAVVCLGIISFSSKKKPVCRLTLVRSRQRFLTAPFLKPPQLRDRERELFTACCYSRRAKHCCFLWVGLITFSSERASILQIWPASFISNFGAQSLRSPSLFHKPRDDLRSNIPPDRILEGSRAGCWLVRSTAYYSGRLLLSTSITRSALEVRK